MMIKVEIKVLIQSSPLTVTPSGQEKSVTISKCHSNHTILTYERPFGTCQNCHCKRGVTVTSVTVSGEVCSTESDPYSTAEDSGLEEFIMAGCGRGLNDLDETEEEVEGLTWALYNAIDKGDLATVTDIIREHPLLLR